MCCWVVLLRELWRHGVGDHGGGRRLLGGLWLWEGELAVTQAVLGPALGGAKLLGLEALRPEGPPGLARAVARLSVAAVAAASSAAGAEAVPARPAPVASAILGVGAKYLLWSTVKTSIVVPVPKTIAEVPPAGA